MAGKVIKVLIVDDSAVVRQTLTEILESDPEIKVIATAGDPFIAVERLKAEAPDVITLDVEMPRMDGITFLQKLMHQHPIPVVMCSSLTETGCETTFRALEYGAVEIITKPKLGIKEFLKEARIRICDAVKAAAQAKVKPLKRRAIQPEKKLTADAVLSAASTTAMVRTTEKVIVIGASTGGTEALREVLESFPLDAPGTVVVQHMPEKFTASFARRLDSTCKVMVKEAADGDSVIRGRVLIAPGNHHTLLKRSGARYYVQVKDGPLVSRHRPSVDVLFRSAARYAGKNAIAAILTGMGDDGANGMMEMKNIGAFTVAQDEESCVVFGMPKEAIAIGAIDKVLPLHKIAGALIRASVDDVVNA
ncbi:MAG: chemotaxis response regulator protein-glutamate methylesterase [Candidatus Zixiibacteriota bacterium]